MLNVKNIFKTAGIMVIATLLAKFMGMYRDVLFAALYGTGDVAQAYLAATRIPLLFFDIALGTAISSSFIPVFNEYIENGARQEAIRFSNIFVNLIFLITLVICVIGIVFSHQVVNWLVPGYEDHVKDLASKLVIILFPTMIFTALAYSLSGVLQSFGEFNVPASISLVSNGFMVVFLLVVKDKLGIEGIAVAMLIGWSFQVLIQLPALVKKKYTYRPVISLRHEGVRKAMKLALPILISSWVQPINTMVNMFLASGLNGGAAVAALDYANKIYIIFVGVLTYAVSNLIFPTLSRMAAGHDDEEFRSLVRRALSAIVLLIVPVMVLFMLLRTPIIRFVYERGEFDAASTALTAKALLFYSMGMVGFAVTEILNKAFYAMHNGKTPMVVAMVGISINIALSFVFVWGCGMQLEGVAIAASVAANLIGLALLMILHQKKKVIDAGILVNFLKILISAVVMGICTLLVMRYIPVGNIKLFALLVPGAAGGLVYAAMICLLRADEFKFVMNRIKQRLEQKRG